MKIEAKRVGLDSSGNAVVIGIDTKDIHVNEEAILSIDGSTSNSGLAILRKRDGAMYSCISVTRESGEEPVRYKVRLKELIAELLRENRNINYVYYEEPIIEYATAVPNLMMLRTTVQELKIENEPEFNYIGNSEINNKKWKKVFIAPEKLPDTSEAQKNVVRDKLIKYMPMLNAVSQDEIDAIAMGYAALKMVAMGYSEEELQSKKKAKPFQYNIDFVGAENEEFAVEYFFDSGTKVPASVLSNGIKYVEINKKANFDKTIYSEMGPDDKLLIIGFPSDEHSDLVLKYKIGTLAAMNSFLYAFVWRKARKKS